MKSFISYSHQDEQMLNMLHKHLAQLKREGLISSWTDKEILAGGSLDHSISSALSDSKLFLALLSPNYIASNYCYEKEFKKALEMQEDGILIIIPIIVEPCDWLSTPFRRYKALPKDGKAVSTWENQNTAFLDVIQEMRKLVTSDLAEQQGSHSVTISAPRNYRVQRDFDSIEKMEFVEKTFQDIKQYLKRYIDEIIQMENIKARILAENDKDFECLLVNRNKIATESHLRVTTIGFDTMRVDEIHLSYLIKNNTRQFNKSFILSLDRYHLFWSDNGFHSHRESKIELSTKEMTDRIWNEWLESVGII